jgi:hypothetical protein
VWRIAERASPACASACRCWRCTSECAATHMRS